MPHLPVTVVVITKNEESAISRCLGSIVSRFDQTIVVDSRSSDRTVSRAREAHAEVVDFEWNGRYPKKKQWSLEHPSVRNDWVLLLDADERVTDELYAEIRSNLEAWTIGGVAAVEVPLEYYWLGKCLRYGYVVRKHILVHKARARFPDIGDDGAPGIREVEGHYQPVLDGTLVRASNRLQHMDPGSLAEWVSRHNSYSDWEAHLATGDRSVSDRANIRSSRGAAFYRLPLKPLAFFVYSYVWRRGFLDGRAGFDYATANAFYYWMIGAKSRALRQQPTSEMA